MQTAEDEITLRRGSSTTKLGRGRGTPSPPPSVDQSQEMQSILPYSFTEVELRNFLVLRVPSFRFSMRPERR